MVKFLKKNFLFLAPMAGYTNGVWRKIFREYGADGTLSEFVHSSALLSGARKAFERISFEESERPVGIQIFGSDPSEMADAASLVEERLSPDFIDVNFGCPAPNAVRAEAGSALLKNPAKMARIAASISKKLKRTPLTAKMRTGWDRNSIIVPDAALALQDSGIAMLTLHGRTKVQAYEGPADWDLIESTARALSIPLIGNGSVEKRDSKLLADSACGGFMIGRAALGNPWIFSQTRARIENPGFEPLEPSPSERARLAYRYAELVCRHGYCGISPGDITFARGQIMRFLKNAPHFKKLRVSMGKVKTLDELKDILCAYF